MTNWLTPAAHEMYDLEAIAFFQNYFRPLSATDDPLIEFNGDSFRRERQGLDQIAQPRLSVKLTLFTINLYPHRVPVSNRVSW
jgi:hypothetical protein